ncbi:DNA -binding domain-containing protein [Terasakiella brassicae]|uniref:DNA -binding domain-containing protein n=1 Tax=Terasakiella brassicae TaxID=1634917 RepID=UPI00357160E1
MLAGKSHRQIAIDLFGLDTVKADWYDSSRIRSLVRRRIEKSKHLMNGGYRDLVISGD